MLTIKQIITASFEGAAIAAMACNDTEDEFLIEDEAVQRELVELIQKYSDAALPAEMLFNHVKVFHENVGLRGRFEGQVPSVQVYFRCLNALLAALLPCETPPEKASKPGSVKSRYKKTGLEKNTRKAACKFKGKE